MTPSSNAMMDIEYYGQRECAKKPAQRGCKLRGLFKGVVGEKTKARQPKLWISQNRREHKKTRSRLMVTMAGSVPFGSGVKRMSFLARSPDAQKCLTPSACIYIAQ